MANVQRTVHKPLFFGADLPSVDLEGAQKKDTKAQDGVTSGQVVDGGLAATAKNDQVSPAQKQAARLNTIATIPSAFSPVGGALGEKAIALIDAQLGSIFHRMGVKGNPSAADKNLAVMIFANHHLDDQVAVATGSAESLQAHPKPEIQERVELAKAIVGELTARLSELSLTDLINNVPGELSLLLAPETEAQSAALGTELRIAEERQELQTLLGQVGDAQEVGWKPDFGEQKVIANAMKNLEFEPGPSIDAMHDVASTARGYLKQKQDQKAMMNQVRHGTGGVSGPIGGPGGHAARPKLSADQVKAQVDANMAKVKTRLAELKAEIADKPAPDEKSKFAGAFLGLAIGDCLGSTTEFMSRDDIRFKMGMNVDLVGGGAFNWEPGQGTDDTQMAVAMARSLVKQGGFDQKDVAKHWVGWLNQNPPDVGGLTRSTLSMARAGVDPSVSGTVPWVFGGGGAPPYENAGNGSVMRAAPINMLTAFMDDEQLIDISLKSSEVTHADPRCNWGVAAMAKGVQLLLKGEENVTEKVAKWLDDKNPTLANCLHDVPKMSAEDIRTSGFVVHTVQAAFWALDNYDNFVDAAAFLANHGEDTDTAGATGGILIGAKFGLEGIPESWMSKLQGREEMLDMSNKIYDLAKS